MNALRGIVLGTLVVLLTASAARADEPKKDDPKDRPFPLQLGRLEQLLESPLLAKEAVEKLKLTAEQMKKYDKIEAEYKDKQRDMNDKAMETLQSADIQKIREMLRNRLSDDEKMHTDYLGKVEMLLTAEQKKTFEEVKKQSPRFGLPSEIRIPNLLGRNPPPVGDVLSKPAQEKLKLTAEQKKRIEELQKDVETKLKDILTDEQKKQLEDLKKETPRRR